MLNVVYAEFRNAACNYAECHGASLRSSNVPVLWETAFFTYIITS